MLETDDDRWKTVVQITEDSRMLDLLDYPNIDTATYNSRADETRSRTRAFVKSLRGAL